MRLCLFQTEYQETRISLRKFKLKNISQHLHCMNRVIKKWNNAFIRDYGGWRDGSAIDNAYHS